MGKEEAQAKSPSTRKTIVRFFWDEYGPKVFSSVTIVILGIVLLGGGITVLAIWTDRAGCHNLHTQTGLPTKNRVTTCYVQVNGQWIPRDNWRGVSDGK